MARIFILLSRFAALFAVAGCISGCTGWVERQVDSASRALDCAVIATAPTPATAQMAHCDRMEAARG